MKKQKKELQPKYWRCTVCEYVFQLGKSTRTLITPSNKPLRVHCPKCNTITTHSITKKWYDDRMKELKRDNDEFNIL